MDRSKYLFILLVIAMFLWGSSWPTSKILANYTDYSEIRPILDMEIEYNIAIAEEGIHNNWGSNIGKLVLDKRPDDFVEKMVAYASAGSDARMSGCEKPVVINSGSGNQGITVSVPIILYAREHHCEENQL